MLPGQRGELGSLQLTIHQQRAVKAFTATAGERLPPDLLKDVPTEQQPAKLLEWWNATGAQLTW